MSRAYNFCAGPATLPRSVIQQIEKELPEWQDQQASIMEISHRCEAFYSLLAECKRNIRKLLQVPDSFKILFMHGGATAQFFSIPMNLLGRNNKADYAITGNWSERAYRQALTYGDINKATNLEKKSPPWQIPSVNTWNIRADSCYLYYTSNETFTGLQFPTAPECPIPLVSDMTSELLSRPIDFTKHGLIFAGVQKTMGISGLAIVIIKEEWLEQSQNITPLLYNYNTQDRANCLCNTLPTFQVYVSNLMCKWALQQGGVAILEKNSQNKSKQIYDIIDEFPGVYQGLVKADYRSKMNVSFKLSDAEQESLFLDGAAKHNLINLKGHRSVGGIRASIYPQQSQEAVDCLAAWMQEFAQSK